MWENEVREARRAGSPERRRRRGVSDAAGFVSCFLNKIFSELNQKTCTVELWVKLFLLKRVVLF